MTSITLSSGHKMPLVGLGLWKVPRNVCKDTVFQAIKSGYRLLDSAADYGNEIEVGQGIKEAIDQGLVIRSELFITSKLWCTHHRKEHVSLALEKTMSDLGVDYLDLYLVHFPISVKYVPIEERYPSTFYFDPEKKICIIDPVPYQETWQAMEQLSSEGKARSIGICNLGADLLMDIMSYAKIKPAVFEMELHPYLTRKQLVEFAQKIGIAITAYSSFGDASYQSMGMVNQGESFVPLLENKVILDIAKHHKVTPAQVVLRWAIQQNIAVIPKSSNPERIFYNNQVFDFALTESQMESIDDLNENIRFNDPAIYTNYPVFAN
ncbi:putative NAD(P)H-dependent D-xylose reductase xyl1 [Smittium culicis]|uniref:Putative NAD(P)H-dependent D-xylose reductase xyl1 n=1 Tax=Smittium culicis TaxID=133412 RepID=A0A1R1YPP6_9FUNG|nr:putative NAD(P)H-dependent D-xylose reductase xyl1 [Smittium culicis]